MKDIDLKIQHEMINSTPRTFYFKMINTEIKIIYINEGKGMPDQ